MEGAVSRPSPRRRWSFLCFAFFLFFAARSSHGVSTFSDPTVGVNYGRLGSKLPPIETAVKLLTSLSAKHVKTFDVDPSVTRAFANTNISLSLCIPNGDIAALAAHPSKADALVRSAILPFHPATKISSISVGNEVSMLPEFAPSLLPAMRNVHKSLKRFRLHRRIKVSTPHSLAVLAVRFPPSRAVFQESIAEPVLRPILAFLNRTGSPFMVNLYPYLTFKETAAYIPLDFALFTARRFNFTDTGTGLVYANLFDMLVDALNSAAGSLGFPGLTLVVTETGWPTRGDVDASVENAAAFYRRLVEHVAGVPVKGTPMRPGIPVMTFLFALFDEDLKWGAPTEKHWGLFFANGTSKYDLNLNAAGGSPADGRRYAFRPVSSEDKCGGSTNRVVVGGGGVVNLTRHSYLSSSRTRGGSAAPAFLRDET